LLQHEVDDSVEY